MIVHSTFARALREAAPGLTKRFFSCQSASTFRAAGHDVFQPSARTRIHAQLKSRTTSPWPREKSLKSHNNVLRFFATSSKRRAAEEIGATGAPKQSRFPKNSTNVVAYWLLGSAASVFGIVVFGGLTRLTESGYGFLQL